MNENVHQTRNIPNLKWRNGVAVFLRRRPSKREGFSIRELFTAVEERIASKRSSINPDSSGKRVSDGNDIE